MAGYGIGRCVACFDLDESESDDEHGRHDWRFEFNEREQCDERMGAVGGRDLPFVDNESCLAGYASSDLWRSWHL